MAAEKPQTICYLEDGIDPDTGKLSVKIDPKFHQPFEEIKKIRPSWKSIEETTTFPDHYAKTQAYQDWLAGDYDF